MYFIETIGISVKIYKYKYNIHMCVCDGVSFLLFYFLCPQVKYTIYEKVKKIQYYMTFAIKHLQLLCISILFYLFCLCFPFFNLLQFFSSFFYLSFSFFSFSMQNVNSGAAILIGIEVKILIQSVNEITFLFLSVKYVRICYIFGSFVFQTKIIL